MTDTLSPVAAFHAHLDACRQCRDHPFALCTTGARLLERAAAGPGETPARETGAPHHCQHCGRACYCVEFHDGESCHHCALNVSGSEVAPTGAGAPGLDLVRFAEQTEDRLAELNLRLPHGEFDEDDVRLVDDARFALTQLAARLAASEAAREAAERDTVLLNHRFTLTSDNGKPVHQTGREWLVWMIAAEEFVAARESRPASGGGDE